MGVDGSGGIPQFSTPGMGRGVRSVFLRRVGSVASVDRKELDCDDCCNVEGVDGADGGGKGGVVERASSSFGFSRSRP